MIVEDECEEEPDNVDSTQPSIAEEIEDDDAERFRRFLTRHKNIQDREANFKLQNALTEHLW